MRALAIFERAARRSLEVDDSTAITRRLVRHRLAGLHGGHAALDRHDAGPLNVHVAPDASGTRLREHTSSRPAKDRQCQRQHAESREARFRTTTPPAGRAA